MGPLCAGHWLGPTHLGRWVWAAPAPRGVKSWKLREIPILPRFGPAQMQSHAGCQQAWPVQAAPLLGATSLAVASTRALSSSGAAPKPPTDPAPSWAYLPSSQSRAGTSGGRGRPDGHRQARPGLGPTWKAWRLGLASECGWWAAPGQSQQGWGLARRSSDPFPQGGWGQDALALNRADCPRLSDEKLRFGNRKGLEASN